MATTSIKLIEQELAHSDAEVKAKFKEKFDLGFEGIIVKPLDGLYERRRTYGYMKIKDEVDTAGDVDLLINGLARTTASIRVWLAASSSTSTASRFVWVAVG